MQVQFKIRKAETQPGQNVFVLGNKPQLGNWNNKQAHKLSTEKGLYPAWQSKVAMTFNTREECSNIEYKYIIQNQNFEVVWESGTQNRKLDLTHHFDQRAKVVVVEDNAFNAVHEKNQVRPQDAGSGAGKSQGPVIQPAVQPPVQVQQQEVQQILAPQSNAQSVPSTAITQAQLSQDSIQLINEIIDLNSKNITWKSKLEFVNHLVQKYKHDSTTPSFKTSGLALLSAFLYFINSGKIHCGDQGHFRPNHSAGFSYNLYKTLDTDCLILPNGQVQSNSHIIRLFKTQLPSFADQFMCQVPMTRIRDIAHRNDIPKEMKLDIKHRLQNKLHRCAEPSDLKTCEELINRVRNGGSQYNDNFKREFEIFYEELKEFFNAQGLDKLLDGIKGSCGNSDIQQKIDKFWHNKSVQKGVNFELSCITELRTALQICNSHLVQDNSKKTLYQQTALADIELEKFLFMKTSEIINHLTNQQGQEKSMLAISATILENILISNLEIADKQSDLNCQFRQLQAYFANFDSVDDRVFLLKLKSTIERGERYANGFTQNIINLFQDNVFKLGERLNIDKHSVMVFSESFVRFHLIFQFSKCMDYFQNVLRSKLNLPPFVTISQFKQSAGSCQGRVWHVAELYDCLKLNHQNQKMIIFLDQADGTEEIPSEHIQAIILQHDLPQLSHLAIRARQTKIMFICCSNSDIYNRLKHENAQQTIKEIKMKDEHVELQNCVLSNKAEDQTQKKQLSKGAGFDSTKFNTKLEELIVNKEALAEMLLKGNQFNDKEEIGSKAYNSLKLQSIQEKSDLVFHTPQQVSVPLTVPIKLGILEGKRYFQVKNLFQQVDEWDGNDLAQVEKLRTEIQEKLENVFAEHQSEIGDMVNSLHDLLSQRITKSKQHIDPKQLLAVRSSSTLEDLDNMAGAGLFDSILNVKMEDQKHIQRAIIDVWLSLYTQRAIISRKQNQIKTYHAQMAVLVQQMVNSQFCFVIHTTNPVSDNINEVYIELAVGQGETLASANQSGTPYRLIFNKKTKEVEIISFANYSYGLYGSKDSQTLISVPIDYSQVILNTHPKQLLELGGTLGHISCEIEAGFGGVPQDIEGCIDEHDQIFIVQSRNQI